MMPFGSPKIRKLSQLSSVEREVTFSPSHTKPYVIVSHHTAPSLIAPLLGIQRWHCQVPSYHRDSGGVVVEDSCIRPFRRDFEVQCGLFQLCLMG
jgi:hypothetical protein